MIKSNSIKRIIYFSMLTLLLTQYSIDFASAQSEEDNGESNDKLLNSDSPPSKSPPTFFFLGGQMVFW